MYGRRRDLHKAYIVRVPPSGLRAASSQPVHDARFSRRSSERQVYRRQSRHQTFQIVKVSFNKQLGLRRFVEVSWIKVPAQVVQNVAKL